MCGRFTLTHPNEALARLFEAAPANDLPQGPRHNICPTQAVAAVVSDVGRRLVAMRWGLIPHWYERPEGGPLLINARAEGIADKPAFAEAARRRRCLIPASGFYEWTAGEEGERQPWYVSAADGGVLAMAGIWQVWARGDRRVLSCAVVTCPANTALAGLHHRMPVYIAPEDRALWLGEAGHGAARLMRPAPDDLLRHHRVGRAVNSNRAEGPELIAPA